MSIESIIDGVLEVEGEDSNHPSDRGKRTRFGITEKRARQEGYKGAMSELPVAFARAIYRKRYYSDPGLSHLLPVSDVITEEVMDTGVNMGPAVAIMWLQRWLNGFNRQGRDYDDLFVDGQCGPMTAGALRAFLRKRGDEGEKVFLRALNCSQGHRYLELAERRESQEDFLYGWVRARTT